ncbi:unnamed protein product [Brassica oleracea]
MFPLGLSLKQDEGHGFLRPVGGHGSEKIFSDDVMKPVTLMESVLRFFMGSQCNSQLHQRHISLHQSILGFENTKEKKVYEPAQYMWILSGLLQSISRNRMPPRLDSLV